MNRGKLTIHYKYHHDNNNDSIHQLTSAFCASFGCCLPPRNADLCIYQHNTRDKIYQRHTYSPRCIWLRKANHWLSCRGSARCCASSDECETQRHLEGELKRPRPWAISKRPTYTCGCHVRISKRWRDICRWISSSPPRNPLEESE